MTILNLGPVFSLDQAAPGAGWQQWEFLATGLRPGEARIRSRAADLAGNVQPERPQWNRLGCEANFVYEVLVRLG